MPGCLQAVVAQLEAERGAAEQRAQALQLETAQQQERESRLVEEANMLRRAVQVTSSHSMPSAECVRSCKERRRSGRAWPMTIINSQG